MSVQCASLSPPFADFEQLLPLSPVPMFVLFQTFTADLTIYYQVSIVLLNFT